MNFTEKSLFAQNGQKRGPKGAQNRIFLGFHKILLLLVAESNLDWETLQLCFVPCKSHIC